MTIVAAYDKLVTPPLGPGLSIVEGLGYQELSGEGRPLCLTENERVDFVNDLKRVFRPELEQYGRYRALVPYDIPSQNLPNGRPNPAYNIWLQDLQQIGITAAMNPIERGLLYDMYRHHVTHPPNDMDVRRRNAARNAHTALGARKRRRKELKSHLYLPSTQLNGNQYELLNNPAREYALRVRRRTRGPRDQAMPANLTQALDAAVPPIRPRRQRANAAPPAPAAALQAAQALLAPPAPPAIPLVARRRRAPAAAAAAAAAAAPLVARRRRAAPAVPPPRPYTRSQGRVPGH